MDRMQLEGSGGSAAADGSPTNRLLVVGSINPATRAGQLQPLFILPNAVEVQPRVPGPYAIVLRNCGGRGVGPLSVHSVRIACRSLAGRTHEQAGNGAFRGRVGPLRGGHGPCRHREFQRLRCSSPCAPGPIRRRCRC